MLTFLKGIFIGLGKILPGVSGSLIAINMGLYDKLIKIVSELKIKQNIIFLIKIGLGIIFGIVLGSKLIYFCLDKYYLYTMSVIIGILLSSIIEIIKIEKPSNKTDYLFIILSFLFIIVLNFLSNNSINTNHNYLLVIILGFIDAVTMIIPGISGTAIFMILGAYEFVLTILGNLLNKYIVFFGIGLLIGIYITTKLVNYILERYHKKFYMVILGFTLSSLLLIIKLIYTSFSYDLFITPFFIVFGFIFGLFFNND